MTELTQEQAKALLDKPVDQIKDFIRANTKAPSAPAWAVRFSGKVVTPAEVKEVADLINERLVWKHTPQGQAYWEGVRRNLQSLSYELSKHPQAKATTEAKDC